MPNRLALLALAFALSLASCSSLVLRSQVAGAESIEPTETRVTTNGDFTITSNLPKGQFAGDGHDEQTTWEFPFETADVDRVLGVQVPLQDAELTLHIQINGETNGELLWMDDKRVLYRIPLSDLIEIQTDGVRYKVTTTLALDVANDDGLTLGEIIDSRVRGRLPLQLRYGDDASITFAKLSLSYE